MLKTKKAVKALVILIILFIAHTSFAQEWVIECLTPSKGQVPGYKWPIAEKIAGGCVFTDLQDNETGEIKAEILEQAAKDLKLATIKLAQYNLGVPAVPKSGGLPRAMIFPGDVPCITRNSCSVESGFKVTGTYSENASGGKELYISGEYPERETRFHELFHSIEKQHNGFKEVTPDPWLAEGIAVGFSYNMLNNLGEEVNVSEDYQRDYTNSLDLSTPLINAPALAAYGTGEFWYAVSLSGVGNGGYGYIKTIMEQQLLTSGSGIDGVNSGFYQLGVQKGLKQVYRDFITKYVNLKDKFKKKLRTEVNLDLRATNKTSKDLNIPEIPYMAAKGALIKLKIKKGQHIKLEARISKNNNSNAYITLNSDIGSSRAKLNFKNCGSSEPIEVQLRVVNTSLYSKLESPKIRIKATVLDKDACSCKPENLAYGDELIAEEKRTGKSVRTYVRMILGGEEINATNLIKPRDLLVGHHIRLGDRRHMGKKQHKNFPKTQGNMSVLGLSPRNFSFKFPIEGIGLKTCRPLTQKEMQQSFREPKTDGRDFCKIIYGDIKKKIQFISTHGTLQIDQWDKDCWIAGSFDMTDKDGERATGVFAFDAGYSGYYDVRTKKRYIGPRTLLRK